MKKLCEYEGRGLPENVKSDCWNDVDETEYACSVGILKDLDKTFLAAKAQLNTCTCDCVCLSVVKTEFLPVYTIKHIVKAVTSCHMLPQALYM